LFLEHLKFALNQEVREWIILYGHACNRKYQKEMNDVFIFIEDIEKRLSREIKDLEDIRLIMIGVKDLRENEIRIDMNITPIEESYAMLQIHAINIPREEIEQSDSLRYRWGKLQNRCVRENFKF
jgi:dynein heavy chain